MYSIKSAVLALAVASCFSSGLIGCSNDKMNEGSMSNGMSDSDMMKKGDDMMMKGQMMKDDAMKMSSGSMKDGMSKDDMMMKGDKMMEEGKMMKEKAKMYRSHGG